MAQTAKQKAAEAKAAADARAKAAAQSAQNAAKAKSSGGGTVAIGNTRVTAGQQSSGALLAALLAGSTPVPAAGPAAGPTGTPAGTPAPAEPARVDPFFTADDLDAINQFGTDLAIKLQQFDTDLQNAETDTTYQKTQTDSSARSAGSAAQDDAISRGIFKSSLKDATLYDIEAQRTLSQKFLDDKLTTARTNAGTNKQILGTAKTNFDTNMTKRSVENAQGVNDANSSAWATAQAAWAAAQPVATPAAGPAPATPAFKPSAPKPGGVGIGDSPVTQAQWTNGTVLKELLNPTVKPPNQSSSKSGTTRKITYG